MTMCACCQRRACLPRKVAGPERCTGADCKSMRSIEGFHRKGCGVISPRSKGLWRLTWKLVTRSCRSSAACLRRSSRDTSGLLSPLPFFYSAVGLRFSALAMEFGSINGGRRPCTPALRRCRFLFSSSWSVGGVESSASAWHISSGFAFERRGHDRAIRSPCKMGR